MEKQQQIITAEDRVEEPMGAKSQSKQGRPARGRGSRQRRDDAFRSVKNVTAAKNIRSDVFARLGISDPTAIPAIQVQQAIKPSVVPVTMLHSVRLMREVWDKMKSVGSRPFSILSAAAESYPVYIKILLGVFDAKVCYAQRTVSQRPPCDLPSLRAYTDQQLQEFRGLAKSLPKPLAIVLETLGWFVIDDQHVVPAYITAPIPAMTGATSLSLAAIRNTVDCYSEWHLTTDPIADYTQYLDLLPNVEWELEEVPDEPPDVVQRFRLAQQSVEFWRTPPAPNERELFLQLMSAMSMKQDFIIGSDISVGAGTASLTVRYPRAIASDYSEVNYYCNVKVSPFDVNISAAAMFGFELPLLTCSRFCTSYDDCLMRGQAIRSEVLRAIVWV